MRSMVLRARCFSGIGALAAAIAIAEPARAQEAVATRAPAAPSGGGWLYVDDGRAPAPGTAVALSRFTYTDAGTGALRPFASNVGRPGALVEAGGEVGLTPWLSLTILGTNDGRPPGEVAASGLVAGLRFAPWSRGSTRASLSTGVLREVGGSGGVWARFALAQDVGRLRLATAVHGEHVFAQARDAFDVMVMAGASYRLAGPLRAGVEYVAQDLEGAFGDDAERGMRHFVSPNLAIELPFKGLTLTGGPAFGLSRSSPASMGRVAVACGF